MTGNRSLVPAAVVAGRILVIRGLRVIIDADLAELYGVETKALNQAVKRNIERFPEEFMFRLTDGEKSEVVTKCDHLERLKYSPSVPYAFTEHGALMLGNVLKSSRAIEVSLLIVRTFVKLRELLASNKELATKMDELDRRMAGHDQAIIGLIEAIKQLKKTSSHNKRKIGFSVNLKETEEGRGSGK